MANLRKWNAGMILFISFVLFNGSNEIDTIVAKKSETVFVLTFLVLFLKSVIDIS